jgi:predicted nucleic acid-binding protein
VSRAILEEYADILSRPELGIRKAIRLQLLQLIKNHCHMVAPSRRLEVASDPDDNMFLECAHAAGADYLVTGNQKHFPVFWKKTKIITSREFISLAAPHTTCPFIPALSGLPVISPESSCSRAKGL